MHTLKWNGSDRSQDSWMVDSCSYLAKRTDGDYVKRQVMKAGSQKRLDIVKINYDRPVSRTVSVSVE